MISSSREIEILYSCEICDVKKWSSLIDLKEAVLPLILAVKTCPSRTLSVPLEIKNASNSGSGIAVYCPISNTGTKQHTVTRIPDLFILIGF